MTSKKIKKFTYLPDTKVGQLIHAVVKYKVLTDVVKIRFKFYYNTGVLEIKTITGAVKNPNFVKVLDLEALTKEINTILDNRVGFEARFTKDMIETQLINQGLIYPF